MKKNLLFTYFLLIIGHFALAQCTTTYLNWDNLAFFRSTTTAPYGNFTGGSYVSSSMATMQQFAFGTQKVTITNNLAAANILGENTLHTGETGTYGTGADIQFKGNGTITFTFQNPVQNVKFSLYDIDVNQKDSFKAVNGTTLMPVTLTKQASSILTITNNNQTNAKVNASSTAAANTSTSGTVNVDITGPVTSFTIFVTNTGTVTSGPSSGQENGSFWISDIQACSSGNFSINYHQMLAAKPFTGQPDYFIATPDNNSVYMVDPATGRAWYLFSEASNVKYVNSFAYDQVNHILYYVTDGTTSPATNKQLKKYDLNTEVSSVVLADIGTSLGILTFDIGVESASAAFYGGSLYLGIEGGKYDDANPRKSVIWRIDFDATLNPITAAQVFAVSAYNTVGSSTHDWGDFLIKDGKLYNFNTAKQGSAGSYTYPSSSYIHYDLITEAITNTYVNPTGSIPYTGQAGMTWAGDMYAVTNTIEKYNLNGTKGPAKTIFSVKGPQWVGSAGDASEPFRPKMDYGDAPASFDPATSDPAVHEMDTALHLGAALDREWVKRGATIEADADTDDGLAFVSLINQMGGKYLTQVKAYNNTGDSATICAWIDYNNNGTFDAAEGIRKKIGSSAAMQSVDLYWSGISTSLTINSNVYLRIRITSSANNMSITNPTNYFPNGEVEDYKVIVSPWVLKTELVSFDVFKQGAAAIITWRANEDNGLIRYELEKANNPTSWKTISVNNASGTVGLKYWKEEDNSLFNGVNYYKLKMIYKSGAIKTSPVKLIFSDNEMSSLMVYPNPAKTDINLSISASKNALVEIRLLNISGAIQLSQKTSVIPGNNLIRIYFENKLVPGNYLLQYICDGNVICKKIVVGQ